MGLDEIPSYVSVKNWVEKCGLSVYQNSHLKHNKEDYGLITDESMMIGSEKMLLTLGTKAKKENTKALNHQDIEILDISVKPSWNSEKIANVFTNIEDFMGKSPSYIISDNASTIKKAVRIQGVKHIRDVSHTLSMFVEREYKNKESFKAFTKDMANVKFRENMKSTSYLLPPKQRVIARFMNLTACVAWAKKLLQNFERLTGTEQSVYNFLIDHHQIIDELHEVTETINKVSKCLKNNGLSKSTIHECYETISFLHSSQYKSVVKISLEFRKYLLEEENKLPDSKVVWNCSSDVIESLFGKYKRRKSHNSLNGVTSNVLMLPVLTKINPDTGQSSINFKDAMESVFLHDIEQWRNDNLTDNLVIARKKILNRA